MLELPRKVVALVLSVLLAVALRLLAFLRLLPKPEAEDGLRRIA